MGADMLNVLIVDDTETSRRLLRHIVTSAPDMQVVGEARNGQQAVQLTSQLRPHVILMDVMMPIMDGLEATREIMHEVPTPIVMISASLHGRETEVAYQAMKLGALTLLAKPNGIQSDAYASQAQQIISTIRSMAGVRVIRHHRPLTPRIETRQVSQRKTAAEIVVIASSTGGPAALSEIVRNLPGDFPLPIVIAQHISADFVRSLRDWIASVTSMPVLIAEPGDYPKPGCIYLASAEGNLAISPLRRFVLDKSRQTTYTPSCDVLLESTAKAYGDAAIGIVLTGMGSDGAQGLRKMADRGALTIAQDEETSAVYGMPKEAAALGAAERILPLHEIAGVLAEFAYLRSK